MALDQLMSKHDLAFDQARSVTFADLAALPAIEIRPTLEYDARVHALRGPLLATVLEHAERFAQCPWGLYSVHVGAAGGR